jgi:peptide chain release factor 1
MDKKNYTQVEINKSEVKREYTRDSGPGGQHRNKTESCVVLTHYPTGIKVKRAEKCQHKNERDAWKELTERVNNFYETGYDGEVVEKRREQIGNGNRGDKRRTYRVQDNLVIDHITGKTAKLKDILRGKINNLKK